MPKASGIALIWLCFLFRVWFYAASLPVWEGYDEWSHFAVVRLVALNHEALPPRDSPLPRDVGASLELVPLPWSWRAAGAPRLTHDAFWQLPAEARAERERAFRNLPHQWQSEASDGPFRAHEAYQPPLYYWTMAPVLLLFSSCGIAAQLLAVRFFGALLASVTIPLTYRIARELLDSERLALGAAAIVALMPGFALVTGHAGNDALAIALFSCLIYAGVRVLTRVPDLRDELVLGVSLGLGLLAKAYFLTAIPVVALFAIWRLRKRAVLPLALAFLIGGWYYALAWHDTGTLTGLTDFSMAQHSSSGNAFQQAFVLPWGRAIDSILFSHLYAGGWSFLTLRSWIYHVFYAVGLVALVGMARVRRSPVALWLAALYACFWLGELYHVAILWAARGVATSMGYYLYGVVDAEVPLLVAGLAALFGSRGRAWVAAACAALFAALDLFAMHAVALPYYTGLIRHKANGALAAFHFSDLGGLSAAGLLTRISRMKAPPLFAPALLALWILYVLATFALVVFVFRRPARDILR